MRNPYLSLIRTSWSYAKKERNKYVIVYLMFIMANAIVALSPMLYGWFINAIQKDGVMNLKYAWWYAFSYLGLKAAEWMFHGPARVLERKLAFSVSHNFLQDMHHMTLHLPVKWHQDHHSGAIISRIRKAYEALQGFVQNGFMYISVVSRFLFSLGAMVVFSPVFGAVGVVLGVLTVYVIVRFDRPFIKAVDESNEKEHAMASTLHDGLSNINTVITLRLEKRMESNLLKKSMQILPPFMRAIKINEVKWFFADILVALIYVVTIVGYVYQNSEPGKVLLIGNLVALLAFVSQFTSVFSSVAAYYTGIVQYDTDVKTARVISEAYETQHRAEEVHALPEKWQRINVNNLNFSYQDTYSTQDKTKSLHNLSFRLEKGKRIALIGESGSGKSTLMAVLRGLYNPNEGTTVIVDGEREVSIKSLAAAVTLFPQEPEIFESSIENNITLGLPFDQKQVLSVCELARFSEIVEQLPNGLQSNIQEKGVNLSGGQKQRLALARGILAAQGSDIILLDEPTSSVDPKTEVEIYERFFESCKEKVVVSSLHRLYLLNYFDYVYILQNGRIVDEGTFSELKLKSTFFQKLWKHQEDAAMTPK